MRLRSAALALLATVLPSFAAAQTGTPNYTTTITLAHLLGGSANIPFASVCATPVDGYDKPITVSAPTWGLIGANSHFCAPVTGGALAAGGLPVPDAAHTNAPSPIFYDILIQPTDAAGKATGIAISLPKVPNISGPTYALDSFAPTTSTPAPAAGLAAGSGVPSTCTVPSIFTTAANDGLAYKCVGGTYQLLAGGGSGGSTPVAAFTGSGPGHAGGIVPDPGPNAGTSRFLNESGIFLPLPPAPTPTGGSSTTIQVNGVAVAVSSLLNFKVSTGSPLTITPDNAGGLTFNVPAITLAGLGGAPLVNPIFQGGISVANPTASHQLLLALPAAAGGVSASTALIANYVNQTLLPGATGGSSWRLFRAAGCTGYTSLTAIDPLHTDEGCGGVFGASGSAHSAGLVPDPGNIQSTSRYLREDGTFAVPASGGGASFPSGTGVVGVNSGAASVLTSAQLLAALGPIPAANIVGGGNGGSATPQATITNTATAPTAQFLDQIGVSANPLNLFNAFGSGVVGNQVLGPDCTTHSAGGYGLSGYMFVGGASQLVFNQTIQNVSANQPICFFDANKAPIIADSITAVPVGGTPFTRPSDAVYMRVAVFFASSDFNHVALYAGTVVPPGVGGNAGYVPYSISVPIPATGVTPGQCGSSTAICMPTFNAAGQATGTQTFPMPTGGGGTANYSMASFPGVMSGWETFSQAHVNTSTLVINDIVGTNNIYTSWTDGVGSGHGFAPYYTSNGGLILPGTEGALISNNRDQRNGSPSPFAGANTACVFFSPSSGQLRNGNALSFWMLSDGQNNGLVYYPSTNGEMAILGGGESNYARSLDSFLGLNLFCAVTTGNTAILYKNGHRVSTISDPGAFSGIGFGGQYGMLGDNYQYRSAAGFQSASSGIFYAGLIANEPNAATGATLDSDMQALFKGESARLQSYGIQPLDLAAETHTIAVGDSRALQYPTGTQANGLIFEALKEAGVNPNYQNISLGGITQATILSQMRVREQALREGLTGPVLFIDQACANDYNSGGSAAGCVANMEAWCSNIHAAHPGDIAVAATTASRSGAGNGNAVIWSQTRTAGNALLVAHQLAGTSPCDGIADIGVDPIAQTQVGPNDYNTTVFCNNVYFDGQCVHNALPSGLVGIDMSQKSVLAATIMDAQGRLNHKSIPKDFPASIFSPGGVAANSPFTGAAGSLPILQLMRGWKVDGVQVTIDTAFSGTGITAATCSIGDSTVGGATDTTYSTAFNLLATTAKPVYYPNTNFISSGGKVTINCSVTGGNLGAINAGHMTITPVISAIH